MRRLFGTDGIRGLAGEPPLDKRTVMEIGRALGRHLARSGQNLRVVIGQDTRESSQWIADTLLAGLALTGVVADSAGVATTPEVAYLARTNGFGAGIVVSASHNPWRDNGIKVFAHNGYKLADDAELEIEKEIFKLLEAWEPTPEGQLRTQDAAEVAAVLEEEKRRAAAGITLPATLPSTLPGSAGLRGSYKKWLLENVAGLAPGLGVVVDCANGAASAIAPEVFSACGARAEFIHAAPDGRNINQDCGALHPQAVARQTAARGADLGITFDGDADRALFSTAAGEVVNGDAILLLAARQMQARGTLAGNLVVATTMSNMGLEAALRRSGIRMLRAPVGDKYVLEEMQRSGAALGGEQSGHIIFRDGEATTGDGLLTALRVLAVMGETGKPLAELVADLHVFPQIIVNVRVREKRPLEEIPDVDGAIRAAERELDGNGRVIVRYSGTERLARVMVEAPSEEQVQRVAQSIAGAIERALGA